MIESLKMGIFEFEFVQFLDLAIIILLLIFIYKFLEGSVAFYMLFALFLLYLSSELCKQIGFKFLSAFFQQFARYGLLIIAVIFQPEIRRLLLVIGRNKVIKRIRGIKRIFIKGNSEFKEKNQINSIVDALIYLSEHKIGAIIVIQQSGNLSQYSDTGTKIYAEISSKLIESIFVKDSPLHDGAMIIEDFVIKVAGCTLPVSESDKLPEHVGLRHKSAVGITEISDAQVFVVSEETGKISFAKEGIITMGIGRATIQERLNRIYSTQS